LRVLNRKVPALRTKLVPFTASAARTCLYAPQGLVAGGSLVVSRVLRSQTVAQLEGDANRLRPEQPRKPPSSCAASSAAILAFASHSQQVLIETSLRTVGFGACEGGVTNGVRTSVLTPKWVNEVQVEFHDPFGPTGAPG
jgi:hypothetical protein